MPVNLVGKKTLEYRIGGPQPLSEFDRERIIALLQAIQPLGERLRSEGVNAEELVGPGGIEGLLVRLDPPPTAEDDAIFYYHRLAGNVLNRIESEYMVNGVMHFWESRYAMGKAALLDWKGVQDEEGHDIPWDADMVNFLPGDIVRNIGLKVGELTTKPFLSPSSALSTGIAAASVAPPAVTAGES
jgi:hypothetical protein